MSTRTPAISVDQFTTFGDLLKYLRRRAGLTQRELSIAVGYSDAMICRLEQNLRLPDLATITARFVPALELEHEPGVVACLVELATSVKTSPNHNLPSPLTSFIGREREMAEIERLLSEHRLVTLTGPGGCGKTRLALQVAAELVAEHPDGVWLVELAEHSDPAFVPQKLASTLGVREEANRPLTTTLMHHLREKRLLLVLDNCEHVIEACVQLMETLLQACPSLWILATSREVLGLAGESIWRVPPLTLPNSRHLPPPERLTQYEAVRLFVDRAVTALPDFTVTTQNAAAVAQVCQRLDGMPLAIELAAARIGLLTVEQIAARLDDRFSLLSGGRHTTLPRHRTLQAAIDWSYDLLSEAERALLRRLSVFVGGWTLEAAEAVCAGEEVEAEAVLDLLTQLVNKSLVIAQREPGRETRYRLLETIHDYALTRLAATGVEHVAALRQRHAKFFLDLVQMSEPKLYAEERNVWLEWLVVEHDNLRVALNWAMDKAPDIGVRLAEALKSLPFYLCDMLFNRELEKLDHTLEQVIGPTETRARVLCRAGTMAWSQGDYTAACSLYRESATLFQEVGNKGDQALSLTFLGRMMELVHGPHAAARSLQEESVAMMRAVGDRQCLAEVLSLLGASVAAQGDEATARSLQEESAALFRAAGHIYLCVPLGYLGYLALRRSDYIAARSLFGESLTLRREASKWGIAWIVEGFAALAVVEEEAPERAARLFGAAEAMLDSIGVRLDSIDRLGYDQYVATTREQLGEAAFAKAWAEGRAMTLEQAIVYAVESQPSAQPQEGGRNAPRPTSTAG